MQEPTPRPFPYSRIRDIVIPLYNYDRFHRPTSDFEKHQDKKLLERSRLINVFIDLLKTKMFAGTYLVAGFRGVGKTSILKEALLRFIKNRYDDGGKQNWLAKNWDKLKNRYLIRHYVIDINLSHKDLSAFDILKTMAWSINDKYSNRRMHKAVRLFKTVLLGAMVLFYTHLLYLKLKELGVFYCWTNLLKLLDEPKHYIYLLIPVFGLFIASAYSILGWDITHRRNVTRLKLLIDRMSATMKSTNELRAGGIRTFGMLRTNTEKTFRELNDKEIAYELSEIINAAARGRFLRFRSKFIFVVDELDKIEPIIANETGANFPNEQLRRKREKIFDLVGELKHFFTMARAKFFFVTGSEMYDASLADVTERDSYLGSIFHHVVYIPSFLTDFNNVSSDITEQTENLLCKFLISKDDLDRANKGRSQPLNANKLLLTDYFKICRSTQEKDAETIKHHYILSSYIKFLTLRSKGSPKKILSLLEENLVQRNHVRQGQELREYYLGTLNWPTDHNTNDYLIFDEVDQYKIGLTGYLYSPFLYSYSSFIANHSDKLILSSAFIWDHLYKYHNAAFSVHHLEYIYELTATSKEPEIKNQLTFLLSLMKSRHLREIRSGIFEFKFFSRISNEIQFLSNVVQSESAVFNFTLDESLSLKRYYGAQLDAINKDFANDSANPYIRGFLSRIIGDLHFFDKEYDRAIVHYENALKYFYKIDANNFSNGELANMVRWLLLLSLANEKSGHFTKSFGICKDIQREFRKLYKKYSNEREFREILLYSKIPYAHIIQKLAIIEKTGLNGLNKNDIRTAYDEIAEIYGGTYSHETNELNLSTDQNLLIKSEINFKIINILFYRNTERNHGLLPCKQRFNSHVLPYMAGLYMQCIVEVIRPAFESRMDKKRIDSLTDVLDIECLEQFCNPEGPNYYSALADYFSKAGNAFITHREEHQSPNHETDLVKEFLKNLTAVNYRHASDIPAFLLKNKYFLAARLIFTAAMLSRKINDNANESAQLLKLLYIIRNLVSKTTVPTPTIGKTVKEECKKILVDILKITHGKNENFKRLYMQKYKDRIFNENKTENLSELQVYVTPLIKSFPDAPDGIEALILYYEIITKYDSSLFDVTNVDGKNIKNFLDTINEHDIVQSQYVRVMELYFKTRYHYYCIETKESPESKNHTEQNEDRFAWLENFYNSVSSTHVISNDLVKKVTNHSRIALDSIYCLTEILRLLNIQRNSFIIGYSYTGNFYHRLGWWIIYKRKLDRVIKRVIDMGAKTDKKIFSDIKEEQSEQVKRLIYDSTIPMLAKYNLEMAKSHFLKAKETHHRGQSYKDALSNMYTMDDDFNDDFSHFLVAIERMSINSGSIDREIEVCDNLLSIVRQMEKADGDTNREDWIFDVDKF